ncbi:winged helix-turn-helix transcriptional regulator [Dictyobacter arantiisoli]|uniref:Transcriptional regulator n=1 Tax=Dictyobacter arantiisoli TaxID=2014874 RepID=A0A5A5TD78_9CHLR|nr:helix-turn-helix domain-containing protein [Dictyobacter arantiisoli]GCF09422.1 transcriptional regulator [Dictyobacter arantiisoli]
MSDNEAICVSYSYAASLISKRWTPLILKVLLNGPRHYSEIVRSIGGISDRILSLRLKELEQEQIISRHVFADIPVRIEYSLTPKGKALNTVVEAIENWGQKWYMPFK